MVPVFIVFGYNLAVYYGTKWINEGRMHHYVDLGVDQMIPLVSPFVLVYVLAFLQWAIGFYMIAREGDTLCKRFVGGELIAKSICAIIFIIYPTMMARPVLVGTDIFTRGLGLLYSMDTATNLFPSIHILDSYLVARASFKMKKVGKGYRVVMAIAFLLITMSVVFIKQHTVIDIIGGILVAELGLAIFRWIEKR